MSQQLVTQKFDISYDFKIVLLKWIHRFAYLFKDNYLIHSIQVLKLMCNKNHSFVLKETFNTPLR